jgi:hypothetical protein
LVIGRADVMRWVAATGGSLGAAACVAAVAWPRGAVSVADACALLALAVSLYAVAGALAGAAGWSIAGWARRPASEPGEGVAGRAADAFGWGVFLLLAAAFFPVAVEREREQAWVLWVGVPVASFALRSNARALTARLVAGWMPGVGWAQVHAVVAGALSAVALALVALPVSPGAAVGGDPRKSTLLITVEGVAHDAPLPSMGPIEAVFQQAVSPVGEALPAAATVLTGHLPPWHGAWGGGLAARPGQSSVVTRLSRRGYATGAFVGRPDLGLESGLYLDFDVMDDRAGPGGVLRRTGLVRGLLRVAPGLGGALGWRGDAEVVASADAWLRDRGEVGSLTWVHLRDPDTVDAHVASLRATLDEIGRAGRTQVIVVGLRGPVDAREVGSPTEAAIRVPLRIVWPGLSQTMTFDAQVRLTDVAPTIGVWLGQPAEDGYEGAELTSFVLGKRSRSVPAILFWRDPGGVTLGYRDPERKVWWPSDDPSGAGARMYDLVADPSASVDVAGAHPDEVRQALEILAETRAALSVATPGRPLPAFAVEGFAQIQAGRSAAAAPP